MRVYLTGFMGAGKSTVGGLLAAELACPFIDLDAAIEAAAGQALRDIFATLGERRFRELENDQLRRTSRVERCVVATGGGTPVDAANRRWMRDHGTIVWLEAAFDRLRERVVERSHRPLWRDETRARQLFDRRRKVYRDCDLAIETEAKESREVAREIAQALTSSGLR